MFLRHPLDEFKSGFGATSDEVCQRYRSSKENDILYSFVAQGKPPIIGRKKDFVSLDEMFPWEGPPPFRARFDIGFASDDPDPDINPSYLPYVETNRINNYVMIDNSGYEIGLATGKRTGYRFYQFQDMCYLASEKKPRAYKYLTPCVLTKNPDNGFPKAVDTVSHPWINIMERNTIALDEQMPSSVEIDGSSPVKPLIYSDFPINDNGRVTQGRAMCMADCAPGMLLKLLHKGQSIWGASGKPPAPAQKVKPF
ncbi:hypothetical protein [Paraburkholderia kirstenboschensis]|uniref:hypothetical protein n=2 Tax=Paraburkholderia kirstenboschensis TaxID=1245436 RepID=UPI001919DA2F|nr:hypothetical protein [Paraburkholderia kirstenboschensis]